MECKALLEVDNLRVEVAGRKILDSITLRVAGGEFHVILGPNGAGKSTLLGSIMGLKRYRVTGGSIRFMCNEVTDLPVYKRARMGIALAFQIPPNLKGLTLRDLVASMDKIYHSRSWASWAEELLGLGDFMDRRLFAGLSGGERKRVELYLTILQKPRLALLDEPDSGVDIESLERIARTLVEFRRRGIAVILVSHTIHLLEMLLEDNAIDAVHVLVGGRMRASGPPEEIIAKVKRGGFRAVAG